MESPGVLGFQVYQLCLLVTNNRDQLWEFTGSSERILEASRNGREPGESDLEMDQKQGISGRLGRGPPKEGLLLGAVWLRQDGPPLFSLHVTLLTFQFPGSDHLLGLPWLWNKCCGCTDVPLEVT